MENKTSIRQRRSLNNDRKFQSSKRAVKLTHYHSHERINHLSSTINEQSKNFIHISIRSINRQHHSNHRTVKHKKHVTPSATKTIQSPTDNHLITPVNSSGIIMKTTLPDQNMCIDEHHVKKNRKLAFFKCHFVCVIWIILGTLILGIAIAALLVGLLTEHGTTTTQTTTTSTTATTTTTRMTLLTTTNEIVYGIWNTTAGSNSIGSTPGTNSTGNYYPGEVPDNVFDNRTDTKYTSFGACIFAISSTYSLQCGENTGFYVTPQQGPSLLLSVQFCTGNDLPNRDPLTITIEGSNQSPSLLARGTSWTLIYNGSTGLDAVLSRETCGTTQSILNNLNWYSSYRVLVTSKRGNESSTQYSEVHFVGYI